MVGTIFPYLRIGYNALGKTNQELAKLKGSEGVKLMDEGKPYESINLVE